MARLWNDTKSLRVGAYTDSPEPFIGPVIHAGAAAKLVREQDDLIMHGGKPLLKLSQLPQSTAMLSPGIIDVSAIENRSDAELFGPLLQLIRVDDFDAAIREANNTSFGLAAGLLSDSRTLYEKFAREIRAGVVNWNRPTTGASGSLPFGGIGRSGNHRPSGYYAADYCSYAVAVMESPAAHDARKVAAGDATMSAQALEMNFDGLVGPTHNYAGLSFGNLASQKHANTITNPKQAALEGLAKMKFLMDLGIPQGVLPPHERPDLNALRRLGFQGDDAKILSDTARHDPSLLASVYSSSAMWAANAATVSPSADTADGRVHFTPANLISQFHRSLEPRQTSRILRAIFPDDACFVHHDPLPASPRFGDEGSANHTRLCAEFAGSRC